MWHPKTSSCIVINTCGLFFLGCWTWTIISFATSFNCYCFKANNFECAICTWVVMGIIPLTLLYLIKCLCKVDIWAKTSNLHIIHCDICGFTKLTCRWLLITKKSPTYLNMQLWGLQPITCVSIATSYNHQHLTMCSHIPNAHFRHLKVMKVRS